MSAWLLRRVRVPGVDAPRDLLVAGGRIRSIGVAKHDLLGLDDLESVDLEGRFAGPGLWDQHVHVGQWALRSARLDVSPAGSAAEVVELVRAHLAANPQEPGTVVVGQGFRDGLWPEAPTPVLLELGGPAVALVSGDVHTVWSNAAALALMGLPPEDWWLREQPAFDLNVRLSEVPEATMDAWVLSAAERAAQRGVVGITDFEFDDAPSAWARRFAAGFRGLRVRANVYPPHLEAAVVAGIRTGEPFGDSDGLLTGGRFKLFTDGSLNTRTAWCDDAYPGLTGPEAAGIPTYEPSALVAVARSGLERGLVPTIHAIGDRATSVALDAFEALGMPADAGERGSIQHAQLVRDADLGRFAALGVIASVQPEHAMDDRDVADHYWAGRTGRAYPFRALLDAGAELELGSDAPVAPLDPWIAIAAAVTRSRDGRDPWHPEQRIPVDAALRASQGGVAALAEGGPADLVITDEDPRTCDPESLRDMPVHATMVAGTWTFRG
ncbi:MAG: amidohydrolase family protein [Microbacteriaceae bacterium]|nr:amidohydrolase family protein [Microbacteriaceae bacterium]